MITARSGEVSKPQECVLKLTYQDKPQQIWEYLLYQLNHWGPVFCVYISELDYYSVKSVSPDHHQAIELSEPISTYSEMKTILNP